MYHISFGEICPAGKHLCISGFKCIQPVGFYLNQSLSDSIAERLSLF